MAFGLVASFLPGDVPQADDRASGRHRQSNPSLRQPADPALAAAAAVSAGPWHAGIGLAPPRGSAGRAELAGAGRGASALAV